MTDTPTIALYYREHDPMKRKMFLDQSIAAGEDEEANAVRKELWELRYGEPSEAGSGTRADGYLALWMAMEYNKDTAGKLFGLKRARKEIEKNLARLKFMLDALLDFRIGDGLHVVGGQLADIADEHAAASNRFHIPVVLEVDVHLAHRVVVDGGFGGKRADAGQLIPGLVVAGLDQVDEPVAQLHPHGQPRRLVYLE